MNIHDIHSYINDWNGQKKTVYGLQKNRWKESKFQFNILIRVSLNIQLYTVE